MLFVFRTSLKRTLTNIVEKKHDKDVCNTNCIENGKFFNQKPHQCLYYPGSPRFNNLLEKQVIDDEASPETTTKSSPNIAEYCLQMIQLNDAKENRRIVSFIHSLFNFLVVVNKTSLSEGS